MVMKCFYIQNQHKTLNVWRVFLFYANHRVAFEFREFPTLPFFSATATIVLNETHSKAYCRPMLIWCDNWLPRVPISTISFWWFFPFLLQYRTDPLGYLSHIVGYEGKGSLTSYLRDRVWALSLAAGNAEDGFENNEVELECCTS